jgi:hypothetical protein
MDGAGAHPVGGIAPERQSPDWLSWLLPPATALVIIVLGVLVLTTPLWMHFALGASWTDPPLGANSLRVSDHTVNQLVFGPGDFENIRSCFSACVGDSRVYTYGEAAHLRDARAVLYLFGALALASLVLVVAGLRHRPNDARRWRSVARGGAGLAIGAVVVGVIGYFAFEPLFELFHRVFFPGGNWEFPADSNMIRLYPYAFWQLTAGALGVLCVIGGGLVWWFAGRRAPRLAT